MACSSDSSRGSPPAPGYTVLIEGEPGIGKSRLMRELARYADALGLPTLVTNCYEIDARYPTSR